MLLALLRRFIRVCPTNQILVITGGKGATIGGRKYGFRLQKGGWTMVVPFWQQVQPVDLTIVPINVRVDGVNSANGIKVGADAFACVCVDDQNETLLYSAVQQLLGKSKAEISDQIHKTMIGNFRAALNKTTPLQAIGMVESAESEGVTAMLDVTGKPSTPAAAAANAESARVAKRRRARHVPQVLLDDCQGDLSPFGIEVVSVSMQRIWDTSNYIANLANKTLSRKRREVEVEEARLHAQADRAESDAERRMQVAESQADERILATRQEVEVFRREREAQVTRARLEADSAIVRGGERGPTGCRRAEGATAGAAQPVRGHAGSGGPPRGRRDAAGRRRRGGKYRAPGQQRPAGAEGAAAEGSRRHRQARTLPHPIAFAV